MNERKIDKKKDSGNTANNGKQHMNDKQIY